MFHTWKWCSERRRKLLKTASLLSGKADDQNPYFPAVPHCLSRENCQSRKRRLYREKWEESTGRGLSGGLKEFSAFCLLGADLAFPLSTAGCL